MARGTKKPRSAILDALRRACVDEAKAVAFLERRRWGDIPCCPRCGDTDVYQMKNRTTSERNKDFRWRCRGCKKQYSVRTGTVMEETRIPLKVWVYAFWKACSSKKGISALQVSREQEVSYKTALYLMHRIRFAMSDAGRIPEPLRGTVEVDEAYIGPRKPRYKGTSKHGRGTSKQPIMALVERGGNVRACVIADVTGATLKGTIRELVDRGARIITDEHSGYAGIGREYAGGHHTTKHSEGEYVKAGTDIHSNTVEGFFALVKRGMIGTFHNVSRKHLHRYLDEFMFRYNRRKTDDDERVGQLIRAADGKRLLYRQPATV